jgi:hypothetical protein
MTTNPDQSVLNIITLDYQPMDFFYYNSNLTPSATDCENIILPKDGCNITDPSWNDISFNCYQQSLCNNRSLANQVLHSQQNNQETEKRETDITMIYDNSKLKTLNLIGGILVMFALMRFMP